MTLAITEADLDLGDNFRLAHDIWTASLAVLIYDYLLTFNDEVNFIWGARLARSRMLFCINRYWAIINNIIYNILLDLHDAPDSLYELPIAQRQITDADLIHRCIFFFKYFGYTALVSHFSIGCILIFRIYPMYNCSKIILVLLVTLFIIELTAEIVLFTLISSRFTVFHLPTISGCAPDHIASYAWSYWIPMTVFESVLFLLACAKSVQFLALHRKHTPTIAVVLLRDSILFFGGVLVLILANLIAWSTTNAGLFFLLPSTIPAFHSILGCRMLLNMQDVVCEDDDLDDTAFTSVVFTHRWPTRWSRRTFSVGGMRSANWTTILLDETNDSPPDGEYDVVVS